MDLIGYIYKHSKIFTVTQIEENKFFTN